VVVLLFLTGFVVDVDIKMKKYIFIIVFSSCANTNIGSVKPPALSIIYPDPTFNNLLVIQESVQDTLVKVQLRNRQN
jgi:hypothetical protein